MKSKVLSNKKFANYVIDNRVFILLAVLWIFSGIVTKGVFFRPANLASLLKQVSVMGILSAGLCVIMAAGSIDLAIGNILTASGLVYGMVAIRAPWGIALVAAVAAGALLGLVNGMIPHCLNLPPFITTLAMGNVFGGIGMLLCDGNNILNLPEIVKIPGQASIFGLPAPMLIMAAVTAIIAIMISKTKIGRQVIATGGSRKAADVSGLNTKWILIFSHVVLGVCGAIGAVVLTGRVGAATTTAGDAMTLDVIASVIIGGTSMGGGHAKPVGAMIGCVLIGTISNMLNLARVSPYWQYIATGGIIVLAVFLNVYSEKYLATQRSA